MKGRFHVNEAFLLGIFHGLFELLRNPGIVIFHNEPGDLCSLGRGQVLYLFNDILRVHIFNYPHKAAPEQAALQPPLWYSHKLST